MATQNKTIITFADNGEGIAKNELKKVFKEFYRSEKGSSVKSHGIGLTFVKQVVEAHKGKISVESSPGEGSKFTIILAQ